MIAILLLLSCRPASVDLAQRSLPGDTGAGDTGGQVDTGGTDTGGQVDTDTGGQVDTDTGGQVDTDTGGQVDTDTGGQVDTDTGASCAGVDTVDPSALVMMQDSGAVYTVTITGCAAPLVITCPEWAAVVAPAELDGEAELELEPVRGWAVPADGSCDIGGQVLTVYLR